MQVKLLSFTPLVQPFSLIYKFLYHQSFSSQIIHIQHLMALMQRLKFITNAMGYIWCLTTPYLVMIWWNELATPLASSDSLVRVEARNGSDSTTIRLYQERLYRLINQWDRYKWSDFGERRANWRQNLFWYLSSWEIERVHELNSWLTNHHLLLLESLSALSIDWSSSHSVLHRTLPSVSISQTKETMKSLTIFPSN